MPELAEVEIMGQNLCKWLARRQVGDVRIHRPGLVHSPGVVRLEEALVGRAGLRASRRGKALLLAAPGAPWGLVLRFGMTGKVVFEAAPGDREGARMRWLLVDEAGAAAGAIAWLDARNLGSVTPVPVDGDPQAALRQVVPGRDAWLEPPDGETLGAWARGCRKAVKVFLMDQRPLAGIGNILATEILFRAGVWPALPAREVPLAAWERVAAAIGETIGDVLTREAGDEILYVNEPGSLNPFQVYGRAGEPCPRCGLPLSRQVLGGRGTVWCARCQPAPP